MFDINKNREQEIKKMVSILQQIDLPGICLLARDANTLLMRQQEIEKRQQELRIG